jgi:hypothetical protein
MIATNPPENNAHQRRGRPERVHFLNCRIEHLTVVIEQPVTATKDTAATRDADFDRERAKLVTAIARRAANGAGT